MTDDGFVLEFLYSFLHVGREQAQIFLLFIEKLLISERINNFGIYIQRCNNVLEMWVLSKNDIQNHL